VPPFSHYRLVEWSRVEYSVYLHSAVQVGVLDMAAVRSGVHVKYVGLIVCRREAMMICDVFWKHGLWFWRDMVCIVASLVTESTPSESINAVGMHRACLSVCPPFDLLVKGFLRRKCHRTCFVSPQQEVGEREACVITAVSTTHGFVE
jgi:hypothetical protein